MQFVIPITHTYSSNLYNIMQTLNSMPDIVACDFETASKWTDSEKEIMKEYLKEHDEDIDREDKRQIRQYIESTGLSHPSLTYVTHFSIAWSPTDAFVAVLPSDHHRMLVLKWLANTTRKQIWHNLSFDGKHILYHTGKFPLNYEDTEVLSKTMLNHVNILEAKVGLKHLMGYKYGDWAVSAENFNLDNMFDEGLIKYAAIDSCATFALWEEIQSTLTELKYDAEVSA